MNAAARWSTGDALLAIAPAGCGDAPRDATPVPSVSAEAAPFVLAPDRPPGLFLESLRPTPPAGDRLVVYSEPGRGDPLTGRVLALTRQDDRNGDLPEGAHAVRISRFGKGRLGRQGGFTWIGWNGTAEEGEDPPYYGVIGKGLTEHELRSAADAVDEEHLRIAPRGESEIRRIAASGARLTIATNAFTLPKMEQIVQRLGGTAIEGISSAADLYAVAEPVPARLPLRFWDGGIPFRDGREVLDFHPWLEPHPTPPRGDERVGVDDHTPGETPVPRGR
ncbi:hypothetical protein [Actinomadura sp. RB99]|uniref:hypothetical protein n=1 Tax=Actinomadura sp. RB99 TaxID=2691577 RepID=UPI001684FC0B|nr:hypothetical protein [Actinomadura sp. RB99]